MTKWAGKESDEAQICEEDEKKGFRVSDTCLEVSNTQAAALNKMRLAIKVWHTLKKIHYKMIHLTQLKKIYIYLFISGTRIFQQS